MHAAERLNAGDERGRRSEDHWEGVCQFQVHFRGLNNYQYYFGDSIV